MSALDALKRDLDGLALEDHPTLVRQKSRDFFWFSPVLKRQLNRLSADLVVVPRSEAEVLRVLAACHAHEVPVTVRGAGTGNYGQAVPLRGGVVLHLAAMNAIGEIGQGRAVAGSGTVLADIEAAARAANMQEIRLFPSTYRRATIGGFIAGGSSGVGSINWGGLRDLGNVIRLRVATMEARPRILELTGDEIHKVSHAYGTNGVVTEVEIPLAQSFDWIDAILGFDEFLAAAEWANDLAHQDGILVKLITPVAAPIPHDYFKPFRALLPRDRSVVLVMVAPHAMSAFEAFVARGRAELLYRADRWHGEALPPVYELSWNHTTLQALKVDRSLTYLQVLYPPPEHLARIREMTALLGDEVPGHLEFVRYDGRIACFGLPLVRYSSDARLAEIIHLHEAHGCPVFDPHRVTLEEGGMKRTDEVQLAFKRMADPKGLLNPGKMLAWDDPGFDLTDRRTYLFPAAGR